MKNIIKYLPAILCTISTVNADTVLIGQNIPNKPVFDGDFETIKANWRNPMPSKNWVSKIDKGPGKAGFAMGAMMNAGASSAVFESQILDHTDIKNLQAGDVLTWRFSSNTEYPCNGFVGLSLIFGDREQIVAQQIRVPNGPKEPEIYEGFYTVTEEDAKAGMPKAKFSLKSSHGIIVYVNWFDLKVLTNGATDLAINSAANGIALSWIGNDSVTIFRSDSERGTYTKIAENVTKNSWIDSTAISGKTYFYSIKKDRIGAISSNPVNGEIFDLIAPAAPNSFNAIGEDFQTKLSWKTNDKDVAYYKIYRGDSDGKNLKCIAPRVEKTTFTDMLPPKESTNSYAVEAIDFSGNVSKKSQIVTAKVNAKLGSTFSDLILPMPIYETLRSDLWGAETVVPRDPNNGIEDGDWSYWGGKAIKDSSDGKYHLNVVRWPEGHRKGHWAWPESTVAYAVSDLPTGPYKIVRDLAYDYKNGLGHNTNIIPLNDGTYAMYSLISWKPTILTAKTMHGPWEYLGEMKINFPKNYKNAYRLERNLSGIHCEDGSFLIVTKAGAMMKSTSGILGPYNVVSGTINENESIPEPYKNANYEDPTIWYDGVQFHMLINAFLEYFAIYLRSPDGINWSYDAGFAYTPTCTQYENGARTFWHKVERPNVIQDEFGRATHLHLAVVDSVKELDYGNDNHSSKNIIIPLVVPKRIEILMQKNAAEIHILILAESGFNPQTDLDIPTIQFGSSSVVNFGNGAKVKSAKPHNDGLVLVFDNSKTGLTEEDFVGKLLGKTSDKKLVVAFAKRRD